MKLNNSWQFASVLSQVVIDYLWDNQVPMTKEIVKKIHHDFEYGIVPNRPRYELPML
jgi:hypothetical protein